MNGEHRALHRLAWGWIVPGALALSVGALSFVAAWQFYSESTRTPGIVVAHQARAGGIRDLSGRYVSSNVVPVVAYRGTDGVPGRVVGDLPKAASKAPPIASPLAVRYRGLADGTTFARIDSPLEIWGLPALMVLFGAGFLAAGLYGRGVALGRQPVRRGPCRPAMADWDGLRRAAAMRKVPPALRGCGDGK